MAQRVSEELGTKMGSLVGYNVRFEKKVSPETRIEFFTDGMLLREAIVDPLLSKYSVIILDEIHEWTISTDVLMGLIKSLKNGSRPDLKIVLMSATIDIPKISKYFGIEDVI